MEKTFLETPETCPECGAEMTRGMKPMTIHDAGLSATFDMPGWYCICGEGVVTASDMDISDRQLSVLKAQREELERRRQDCRQNPQTVSTWQEVAHRIRKSL